jgi:hypothetical protein
LADLLTKVVTGQKRWGFCYCLFCWVGLTARLYWRHVATVLPSMPVERDRRLYNMGQCMVEYFSMSSCMFTDIQTTCGDWMNYDVAVWQQPDTSAEWYLFGGCNVLVVTTFRTGLLLFPLLFIVITRTWWVRQHLLSRLGLLKSGLLKSGSRSGWIAKIGIPIGMDR